MHRQLLFWAPAIAMLAATPCAAQEEGLTAAKIIELLELGFGEDEIIDDIRRRGSKPKLSDEDLNALEKAGAKAKLLAFLRPKARADNDIAHMAVLWHKLKRKPLWILQQVTKVSAKKRSLKEMSKLSKLLPQSSWVALHGEAMSRNIVAALFHSGASLEEIHLLDDYVGHDFTWDVETRRVFLEYRMPVAWMKFFRSGKTVKKDAVEVHGHEDHVEKSSPPAALVPPTFVHRTGVVQTDPVGNEQSSKYFKKLAALNNDLISAGQLEEAREEIILLMLTAKFNNAPYWVKVELNYYLGLVEIFLDRVSEGLRYIGEAVDMGYSDVFELHDDVPEKLHSHPKLQAIYSKICMTVADKEELLWLAKEIQSVHHDTSMMITNNINRADSGYTQVLRTTVPVRKTTNPSIIYVRECLRWAQHEQRGLIFQSDTSRISHNTSMAMYRNMGAKPNPVFEMQRIMASRTLAQQRDAQHALDISRRAFKLSATASDKTFKLPPLGSIPSGAGSHDSLAKAKDRHKTEGPLVNLEPGSWYLMSQKFTISGTVTEATVRSIVTHNAAGRLTSETITEDADHRNTESETLEIKRSIKEQLLYELGKHGKVTLQHYSTKAQVIHYKHQTWNGQRISMKFTWELPMGTDTYTAYFDICPEKVGGMGYVTEHFETSTSSYHYELLDYKWVTPKSKVKRVPSKPVGVLSNAKVGSWWRYSEKTAVAGKVTSKGEYTERWTGRVKGRLFGNFDSKTTETTGQVDFSLAMRESLVEQILETYREDGVVAVEKQSVEDVMVDYKGNSWPGKKVSLTFDWVLDGRLNQCKVTYFCCPDKVGGFGAIRLTIQVGDNWVMEQELLDYKWIKD